MSREIIINATLPETRIAQLEDNEIQELHIERESERGIVGNIYKGKVLRVLPGMQAAFVDIGLDKAAFLYVDDIFFPDMKTPMKTRELPEGFQEEAEDQTDDSKAAKEDEGSAQRSDSHRNDRGRRGRFQRNQRGSGRGGRNRLQRRANQSRRGRGGNVAKPSVIAPPGQPISPEDHAQLQAQYGKQMVDVDDEAPYDVKEDAPKETPAITAPPATAEIEEIPKSEHVINEINGNEKVEAAETLESPESNDELDVSQAHELQDAPQTGSKSGETSSESSDDKSVEVSADETLDIDPIAWAEELADEKRETAPDEDETEVEAAEKETLKGTLVDPTLVDPVDEVGEESEEQELAPAESPSEETSEETIGNQKAEDAAPAQNDRPRRTSGRRQESYRQGGRWRGGRNNRNNRRRGSSQNKTRHYHEDADGMPSRRWKNEKANIADLVKEGQEILVQVAKDPIGTKGARLTCHVSLPGRYLVFMPTVDHVGVSRRIEDDSSRRRLKERISNMRPPKTGVIVRTASGTQTDQNLKSDLDYLVETWNDVQKQYNSQKTPCVVYQDLTIVLRAIRDMFTDEVGKVVVDSKREHESIMEFVTRFMPQMEKKVDLYEGEAPIFDYYGIEVELERALERKVWLKSGGYIVVDQAEALIAIDVNTGRYVGKKNLEETILKTNLEAVREIAYQLRLRNCGGIIIIDLIDMENEFNREKVYRELEIALRKDRSRPTIVKLSQLGLIEMTRKRTRESLTRSHTESCTFCHGRGFVKNSKTVSYEILRDIQREGPDKDNSGITIQCHSSVADILLDDLRDVLESLEHQYEKKISVRANGAYHMEQYEIVVHRGDDKDKVFSSDERRQQLRSNVQKFKNQRLAGQKKKGKSEGSEEASDNKERKASGDSRGRRSHRNRKPQRNRNRRNAGGRNKNSRSSRGQSSNQQQAQGQGQGSGGGRYSRGNRKNSGGRNQNNRRRRWNNNNGNGDSSSRGNRSEHSRRPVQAKDPNHKKPRETEDKDRDDIGNR